MKNTGRIPCRYPHAILILCALCAAGGPGPARACLDYGGFASLSTRILPEAGETKAAVSGELGAFASHEYIDDEGDYISVGVIALMDLGSLPETELLARFSRTGFRVGSLALDPGLLFLGLEDEADAAGRLEILDVTNPVAPLLLSATPLPFPPKQLLHDAAAGVLYLGDWQGLQIFDVADPSAPAFLADAGLSAAPRDLALDGTVLWVDLHGVITGVEVSTPAAPVVLGSVALPHWTESIAIEGDYLYATYQLYGEVYVVDISDPALPFHSGTVYVSDYTGRLAVSDGTLLVGGSAKVFFFDLADPAAPAPLCDVSVGRWVEEIHVVGRRAVLDVAGPGWPVVDWTHRETPDPLSFTPLPVRGLDVALDGTQACVLDDAATLHCFDLSDPANPVVRGQLSLAPLEPEAIGLRGGYLYVAAGGEGLLVVDLNDPESPTLVAQLPLPGDSRLVGFEGASTCLTASYPYVHLLDLADPAAPALLSSIVLTADWLCAADGLLAAGWLRDFRVYDVSDPASPALLGTAEAARSVDIAAVGDGLLFLVEGHGSSDGQTLVCYDLADPGAPLRRGELELAAGFERLRLADGLAYLGGSSASSVLHVVDVTVPDGLRHVGSGDWFGFPDHPFGYGSRGEGLCVGDGFVVFSEDDGLYVLPSQCRPSTAVAGGAPPAAGLALCAFPNPFNPTVTLRFRLERAEHARVTVHDPSGRRVATLADRRFDAGTGELRWDGRDGSGRRLAGGVYLARLEAAGEVVASKLILLQ